MRICVIFNPAAHGSKARHFRHRLQNIGPQCALKPTTAPGDARRLAAEAVGEGYDLIVAAGGDGTINEVLNGLGDAPDGFERARLGVLPLGTVNVFARELKIPLRFERAWEVLQRARETRIDLPHAEFLTEGKTQRRYFVQLAGAGFDARAVELVNLQHKKRVGPLAYVIAGLKVLPEPKSLITVHLGGQPVSGEQVLVGNGRFYGGPFEVFPQADLRDGMLDICVFPEVNWRTLFRSLPGLLTRRKLPAAVAQHFRAPALELAGGASARIELDGEWVGHLPAKLTVELERLRVVAP